MSSLKCSQMEIIAHSGIYIKTTRLVGINSSGKTNPTSMFTSLLLALLPMDLIKSPGVSRTEVPGCTVGLPTHLLDTIESKIVLSDFSIYFLCILILSNILTLPPHSHTHTHFFHNIVSLYVHWFDFLLFLFSLRNGKQQGGNLPQKYFSIKFPQL